LLLQQSGLLLRDVPLLIKLVTVLRQTLLLLLEAGLCRWPD